jgi:hypothetical protein
MQRGNRQILPACNLCNKGFPSQHMPRKSHGIQGSKPGGKFPENGCTNPDSIRFIMENERVKNQQKKTLVLMKRMI